MDTHHPMASLGAFYPSGHPPMMPPPPPDLFQPRLHQLQTYSMESIGSYSDMDDPSRALSPHQQRSRRRNPPGSEHVKHRRTRSGCYTCRQRRVKCDEGRPICERCRKGKRECTYPRSPPSSKSSRSGSKTKDISVDSASSASDDEGEDDGKQRLPTIADSEHESTMDDAEPTSSTADTRSVAESQVLSRGISSSPLATRPSAIRSSSKQAIRSNLSENPRWNTLSKDVRKYVDYHIDSLSYHHYAFKYDGGDFLKTTFLEIAMNDQSQALLYAIVAFSAYHSALAREDDRISNFLSYYNQSIVLLQQSLKSKRPSVTTLLTILQLATIEEFLGDWVNLLGHQRAALQILTDLFTPQTIMQDETRRKIIAWYIRFDLFAGMMSGGETHIGRDWFAAVQDFYRRQTTERPSDLGAKFEDWFATSRLLATDVALLIGARSKGAINDEQFANRSGELVVQFANFGHSLDVAFEGTTKYVSKFPNAPPPGDADITDFRDPKFLYGQDLFTMNFVLMDFWGIDLMFKYQLTVAQRQQPTSEMAQLALKKCKLFEAIEHCDEGPHGAVLGCQASLGIACILLPKDERHTDWARRKFALIEQKGYIYPASLRMHMSEAWGVDVSHWWLPNDEGYPAVVRALREFIEYRKTNPADMKDIDVRDMNGIFRGLHVDNGEQSSTGTDESDQLSPAFDFSMPHDGSPELFWQS